VRFLLVILDLSVAVMVAVLVAALGVAVTVAAVAEAEAVMAAVMAAKAAVAAVAANAANAANAGWRMLKTGTVYTPSKTPASAVKTRSKPTVPAYTDRYRPVRGQRSCEGMPEAMGTAPTALYRPVQAKLSLSRGVDHRTRGTS
jgi:hypothetical protein